jgi:hypothetical protein
MTEKLADVTAVVARLGGTSAANGAAAGASLGKKKR